MLHCLAYNLHNYANGVAAIRLQGSSGLLFLRPRSSLKHRVFSLRNIARKVRRESLEEGDLSSLYYIIS